MSFTNENSELARAGSLDSELLRTFLAIAETGSFTKGAERIFRSQPAVSLQIKRLEEILGSPVFERRARGVELSPLGERLRPAAERIVGLLDETAGELRSDAVTGRVRIGIPDEYARTILPGVISRFTQAHPRVEVSVRCGFSADFPALLERGELDLAVHAVERRDENAICLREEKTVWATSSRHLAHERRPLPLALFDRACWWRERAVEALEASGLRYHVAFSSESVNGVMAAIEAGAAIGLLGESSLGDGLRILTAEEGFPHVPSSELVLDHRGTGSKAAMAMRQAIMDAFA